MRKSWSLQDVTLYLYIFLYEKLYYRVYTSIKKIIYIILYLIFLNVQNGTDKIKNNVLFLPILYFKHVRETRVNNNGRLAAKRICACVTFIPESDIGCVQQRKQLSKRFVLIGLYF